MKKWNASVREKFEDLPHNVRNWREALRRASQTLENAWDTASGERLPVTGQPSFGFKAEA